MKIRIKKRNKDGIVRLESSGVVKEVILNEDFLNPKNESIAICFKGKDSSGILEISQKEFDLLKEELDKKKAYFKDFKVMKFDK